METNITNILFLIIGAVIGFIGSILIEYIKRRWAEKDQKEKNKRILKAIEKEIKEGVDRCEKEFIQFEENNNINMPFYKIYIKYWESINLILTQHINDIEILNILHHIYCRFEIINFNMELRPKSSTGFVEEYLPEIKENLKKLTEKIKNY